MLASETNSLFDDKSHSPTLLVFGPHQGTVYTKGHVEKLIRLLANGPHSDWIPADYQ